MSEIASKFTHLLETLTNYDQPFPPGMLRDFSDLTPVNLHALKHAWPEIKRQRKISLLEDLETVAESDTLVNFDELAKMSLFDEDPAVRVLSIRLLWECEEAKLIPVFTEMMLSDPAEDVRAAAASALGKFVLLGELDAIPDNLSIANVQNLLDVVSGEDLPMVRRRALESLGFSCNPKVAEVIEKSAKQEDPQWITSALYAMARSADDRWSPYILEHLESPDGEVEFEAIRAAGELGIEEARDTLFDLLDQTTEDEDLRYALIWSLSQIGGESVKRKFEEMAKKCTDDEEAEWLEKALDNLELGGTLEEMEMLEFDPDVDELAESYDSEEGEEGLIESDDLDEEDFEN